MDHKPVVYFRADGNRHIAAGHLVRCLSIAQACLSLGQEVCFLLSDEDSREMLLGFLTPKEAAALSIRILPGADYREPERELPVLAALLQEKEAIFFLDSYFVTENYLASLNRLPGLHMVYLDDLQLFDYPVDLVINYDIIPPSRRAAYEGFYQKAGQVLLGAAYAPLRPQFQRAFPASPSACCRNVLITTGGSDPCHFCLTFLKKLFRPLSSSAADNDLSYLPLLSLTYHVVIGSRNTDRDALYALAAQLPALKLHEQVTDMAALMGECDLALSAAGTTLYELCAAGIPTLSFLLADNQKASAEAFALTGAITCAGDLRKEPEAVLTEVFRFLTEMSQGKEQLSKRQRAREAMQKVTDGKGALRIARAALSLLPLSSE